VNKLILALAVLAGIHVSRDSSALAQNRPAPSTGVVVRSADNFVDQQLALMHRQIDSVKRQLEEIYANDYRDLEHLLGNIEAFIEEYYNRCRLHSALGYRPPEEFEQEASPAINSAGATMSFFRHGEIYQSDVEGSSSGERPKSRPPAHRSDESPAGYSSASCSPAELASASPAERHLEREEEI